MALREARYKALGTLAGLLMCAGAGAQSNQGSSPAAPKPEDAARLSVGPGLAVRFIEPTNKRARFAFRDSMELAPGHYVVGVSYFGALNADSRTCRLEFDATSDRAYIIVPHRSSGAWAASLRSHEMAHDSREVADRKFDALIDIECKFDGEEEK